MRVLISIKVPGETQFESHQCLVELDEDDLEGDRSQDVRLLIYQAERRIIEWLAVSGHVSSKQAMERIEAISRLKSGGA